MTRCRGCRDVFRCFRTYTHLLWCARFGDRQAMSMGFGGNPYGPAGTGKTESVKALGYLFGRQVLVFNCDEGIDIKSLTRILIGLARCGAWGCFDEFNRLEDSTLSMISTRIHPIQEAIKNKETSFVLDNQKVKISIESVAVRHLLFSSATFSYLPSHPINLQYLYFF